MCCLAQRSQSAKKILTEVATCGLNTLNQDIIAINDLFAEDLAQVVEVDKKLFLHVPPDINFDYLVAYKITTSDLFELSLSMFNDEKLLPHEWATKKYVGLTSYYAKLKEMDTYLAESS